MTTKEKHLYQMSELKDYKINPKDPDIRGWDVRDYEGRVIGKVDNLLVNKELGKVVYIDVEVDQSIIDANHDPYRASTEQGVREFINEKGENHIIIPIGLIDVDTKDKYVFSDSITYQTFAETKRFRPGAQLSRDYERHVIDSYDRRREYATKAEQKRHKDISASHERFPKENPGESATEAQIRREKENLRYESEKRRRKPFRDDYDEERSYRDEVRDLRPERTYDEDRDWERDQGAVPEKNPYKGRKRRITDEFYDRKEFH